MIGRIQYMNTTEISGWVLDKAITPGAGLTQGDLIRFDSEEDPLRSMGIVVTADCDLERKKHARLVTLIPVVSVRSLLENYLLPEDCERKRDQIEIYALKNFGIDRSQEPDARRGMLIEKISSNSGDVDAASLLAAKFLIDQLDSISIAEYKVLMDAIKIKVKKIEALTKQIVDRGDLLILPTARDFGIVDDIAWVRHIWQVPISSIAIKTSEVKMLPGERIARLDSPYRYRLTQLMAQVFSDIGLPDIPHSVEERITEVYGHD